LLLVIVAACRGPSGDPTPSNRREPAPAPPTPSGKFTGVIGGHKFSIVIDNAQVTTHSADNWTWRVGSGRVVLDAAAVDAQTSNLVARSPRTIMRNSDGLWVVTEVVVTAGGRAFTCLHQQVVGEGSAEARAAASLGVAACSSLHVDP